MAPECLKYSRHQQLWDLHRRDQLPLTEKILGWSPQTAQFLRHAHSRGLFQVEQGPHNILLDWNEIAKLSDFVGSSTDGFQPCSRLSIRSEYPNISPSNPAVMLTEILTFGTSLYKIETTRSPDHHRDETEVENPYM